MRKILIKRKGCDGREEKEGSRAEERRNGAWGIEEAERKRRSKRGREQ